MLGEICYCNSLVITNFRRFSAKAQTQLQQKTSLKSLEHEQHQQLIIIMSIYDCHSLVSIKSATSRHAFRFIDIIFSWGLEKKAGISCTRGKTFLNPSFLLLFYCVWCGPTSFHLAKHKHLYRNGGQFNSQQHTSFFW